MSDTRKKKNLIVQHRRGSEYEWGINPDIVLEEGEIGVQLGNKSKKAVLKVGDGQTPFVELDEIGGSAEELEELYSGQTKLQSSINQLGDTVNNLSIVDGLEYINNTLYLKSKGQVIGEGIEIIGGAGGTGGAGSSFIDHTLEITDYTTTAVYNGDAFVEFEYVSYKTHNNTSTGQFTCEVYVNNVLKETLRLQQAADNSLNKYSIATVGKYLQIGANDIRVKCTDTYGNVDERYFSITAINLVIASDFSGVTPYQNDSQKKDDITIRCTPYGDISKEIHFLLEDKEIKSVTTNSSATTTPYVITMDEINKQFKDTMHGAYRLSMYMTASIDGELLKSNTLEYEIIIYNSTYNQPIISSYFNVSNCVQGEQVSIPYQVFHRNSVTNDVTLTILSGGEEYQPPQTLSVSRDRQYWNTRRYPKGEVTFRLQCTVNGETAVREHTITVSESTMSFDAVADNLELYLSPIGRSNSEAAGSINQWTFKGNGNNAVTTTFDKFNFVDGVKGEGGNGWCIDSAGDTCLRLNGGATVKIGYNPFSKSSKESGKTIELDFCVRNINKRNTTLIECWDKSTSSGLMVTSDYAELAVMDTSVRCLFKDNERVRVSFTVEPADGANKFIRVYLDGILSGIAQYTAASQDTVLSNVSNILIGASNGECEIDIYGIRVYNSCLNDISINENYIADLQDLGQQRSVYDDNNIYDEDKQNLSYYKVLNQKKLPVLCFIGKLPTYKGDKKKKSVRAIFNHPEYPELNFDEILEQVDVQGTSSQYYIRKNWKIKFSQARRHMVNELPARVFCLKVDYAESTGTHNTQNANLIETFYEVEELNTKLPPKNNIPSSMSSEKREELEKVRTTITGYPILIFHLDTSDTNLIQNITPEALAQEPAVKFYAKGNFNYDKDAEDVFAFNEDYDVECWEFLQNENPNSFLVDWPENPSKYFEARYHRRLGELEDAQDAKDEKLESKIFTDMIARFKTMYEWVRSTDRNGATNELFDDPITIGSDTFYGDSSEYRLAKFKNEFRNWFNLPYSLVYYVYTFFALMVDQRAKNMFLTYWLDNPYKEESSTNKGHWYPYFYDNDTCFGIDNSGNLVFDYYHEDADTIGNSAVYNGVNSVLWCNFRDAFESEIADTYKTLRTSGKISAENIARNLITNGSDKYSAAVYNEDADYKYVVLATDQSDWDDPEDEDDLSNITTSFLYEVRGNGEHHLRKFLQDRIKYCDSKWKCGNYISTTSNVATIRIYTPTLPSITLPGVDMSSLEDIQASIRTMDDQTLGEYLSVDGKVSVRDYRLLVDTLIAVPATQTLSITPFSNTYCGVSFGSSSGDDATKNIQQKKASAGQTVQFTIESSTAINDLDTYVYGASDLSSIGDLSAMYCKLVSVGTAKKLTELKLGSRLPGYTNLNLESVSVASNPLLKLIDVSNCPNFKGSGGSFNVSNCSNLREFYAGGTGLSSVNFPNSGYLNKVVLPSTLRSLVLRNQNNFDEENGLVLEGLENLNQIYIENCNVDVMSILDSCLQIPGLGDSAYQLTSLGLIDVNWTDKNRDYKDLLLNKFPGKIGDARYNGDNIGTTTNHPYITGVCYISELTGNEMAKLNELYPELIIKFDALSFAVTFRSETGEFIQEKVYTINNSNSKDARLNVPSPLSSIPSKYKVKEPTIDTEYVASGWTKTQGNLFDEKENALNNLIGDTTVYVAFSPKVRQYSVKFRVLNVTTGQPSNISTQSWDCYTPHEEILSRAPKIEGSDNWTINWVSHLGYITESHQVYQDTIFQAEYSPMSAEHIVTLLPEEHFEIELYKSPNRYKITKFKGDAFSEPIAAKILNYYEDKDIYIDGIEKDAFRAAIGTKDNESYDNTQDKIRWIELEDGVSSIGSYAFYGCRNLNYIKLPTTLSNISEYALAKCGLVSINVPCDNLKSSTSLGTAMCSDCKVLSRVNLYQDSKNQLVEIPASGFNGCSGLSSVYLPNWVTRINNQAFQSCTSLNSIQGCENLTYLGTMGLYNCLSLNDIEFTPSLKEIGMYALGRTTEYSELVRVKFNSKVVFPKIANANPYCPPFSGLQNLEVFVPWRRDEEMSVTTAPAPWGAINAKVHYITENVTVVYENGIEKDVID